MNRILHIGKKKVLGKYMSVFLLTTFFANLIHLHTFYTSTMVIQKIGSTVTKMSRLFPWGFGRPLLTSNATAHGRAQVRMDWHLWQNDFSYAGKKMACSVVRILFGLAIFFFL